MDARDRLRELLHGPGYTVVPGAYDALSALVVERAGFEAVYLTGGGFSRSQGYPDLGLLTMSEITAFVVRVVDAVSLPVIGDMDTGYGNSLNVIRAMREFERTGAAGAHLEDQVAPKRCGHYEDKEVISVGEMVGKIKAALDHRNDERFVLIARSDARAVEGLEAAIDRVGTYLEAGADVGFVEAPQSVEELEIIAKALPGATLLVNIFEGGKTPPVPAAELEAMGYRIGIYPSQTQRTAIRAMSEVLGILRRDGHLIGVEDRMVTFAEREELLGTPRWHELEARYLSGD
jgi:2,3-dimethylmalate lyase